MRRIAAILGLVALLLPTAAIAQSTPETERPLQIADFLPLPNAFGDGWNHTEPKNFEGIWGERTTIASYFGPSGSSIAVEVRFLGNDMLSIAQNWSGIYRVWQDRAISAHNVLEPNAGSMLVRTSLRLPDLTGAYSINGQDALTGAPIGIGLYSFSYQFAILITTNGTVHRLTAASASDWVMTQIVSQLPIS